MAEALAESVAGRGRLVLIGAGPGMGKTRLVSELAATAADGGVDVVWGRCWEGEGGPPFWPWLQILRAVVRLRGVESVGTALGSSVSVLATLVPELQPSEEPPARLPLEADQARLRVFDTMARLLLHAGDVKPLILILDDLHCADGASLQALEYLTAEIERSHLLIVAAYRDREVTTPEGSASSISRLARRAFARSLALAPLDDEAVQELLRETAGVPAPRRLAAVVHERTAGNPLFILHIARDWVASGAPGDPAWVMGPHRLPPTIRDAMQRHVRGRSQTCRRFLAVASVLGRDFDAAVARALVDESDEAAASALDEALVERLLSPIVEAPGHYRFDHVLLRDTLYDDLSSAERRGLHRRAAELLDASDGAAAARASAVAHHFREAVIGGGDVEAAISYSLRAADCSEAILAYEDAAVHLAWVIKALEAVSGDDARRCEMLLRFADAERKAGHAPEARAAFQEAASVGRRLGRADFLARAALGLGEPWTIGTQDPALIDLLEEALQALGPADSALRVRVLGCFAWAIYLARPAEQRQVLTREALEMAARVGDEEAQLFALGARHNALWSPRNTEERCQLARSMVTLAERINQDEIAVRSRLYLAADLLELGDVRGADHEIERACVRADELRQPRYRWHAESFRAARLLMRGLYDEAERHSLEAWVLGRRSHVPLAQQYRMALVLALRRDRGTLADVLADTEGMPDETLNSPVWMAAVAWVNAELGREEQARAVFEVVAGDDFGSLRSDIFLVIALAMLAEVCRYLDDRPRAELLYRQLAPFAERNIAAGGCALCLGSASSFLGILASVRRQYDDAVRHFERGLAVNTDLAAPPLIARTQYEYARMLRQRGMAGDEGRAAELAAAARHTAVRLSLDGLVRDLDRAAAPPTGSAVNREERVSRGGENNFRREGQYWSLRYRGREVRLKDNRGLRYINHLLQHPRQEFHAMELAQRLDNGAADAGEGAARCLGDSGLVLDARAVASYRRRLRELRDHLAELQAMNDLGRAAAVRDEMETIAQQLSAGVGAGGKLRRVGSASERARVSVRNSITVALNRIREHHEPLWRHLFNAIKTGTYCSYAPENPTEW